MLIISLLGVSCKIYSITKLAVVSLNQAAAQSVAVFCHTFSPNSQASSLFSFSCKSGGSAPLLGEPVSAVTAALVPPTSLFITATSC